MSFKRRHSLASRAAVSVVVSLWYHEDIDSLKHLAGSPANGESRRQSPFDGSWFCALSAKRIHRLALHKSVTDSVSKLCIPESLKRFLLEFVQVIGENLEDWIEDHFSSPKMLMNLCTEQLKHEASFFEIVGVSMLRWPDAITLFRKCISADLRKVLRWDPDGEIDLEQTGEALVRNERDPIERFRLACAYCREDDMLQLWPSVWRHFSRLGTWDSNIAHGVSSMFWFRYFRFFWPESISTYLLHLESTESVEGGKVILAELRESWYCKSTHRCSPLTFYLLKKICLRPAEQVDIILQESEIADKRFGAILLKMPESYQVQILSGFTKSAFKQLLFWRHQNFFMDTVERSWDFFDEDLFDSILAHIARGVEWYADSDIYRRLFTRFWTGSPARLRDVERIFYDREVVDGRTLRQFVDDLFGHPSAAEERVKRVLFGGRHVLELATGTRVQHVLMALVRTCLPKRERMGKLRMLNMYFGARTTLSMFRPTCVVS